MRKLPQMYVSTIATTFLFLVCFVYLWSPIGTAPTNNNDERSEEQIQQHHQQMQEENEEEQLQSLKSSSSSLGSVAMVKSDSQSYNKVNGKSEMHKIHQEKVEDVKTGKTVAKISKEVIQTAETPESEPKTVVKTEVDIPSKGIHDVTVNKKTKITQMGGKENSDRIDNVEDYFSTYDSIQYTPTDMAEYIRKTGDDEGVALAVEELMKEGMISRNEAVNYLEDVKNELLYAQDHEFNDGRDAKMMPQHKMPISHQASERHPSVTLPMTSLGRKPQHLLNANTGSQRETPSSGLTGLNKHAAAFNWMSKAKYSSKNEENESEDEEQQRDGNVGGGEMARRGGGGGGGGQDEMDEIDYRNLLERLRIADFLYKEYSLEEVIYQLAKEMFTQSIIKGNREAEESLQRFSNFLQEETAEGRISKEEETKILDVVMAALMDAVGASNQQQEYRESQTGHSLPSRTNKSERNQSLKNKIRATKQDKNDTKAAKTKEQPTYDTNKTKDHKVDAKSSENASAKV